MACSIRLSPSFLCGLFISTQQLRRQRRLQKHLDNRTEAKQQAAIRNRKFLWLQNVIDCFLVLFGTSKLISSF
jgi:hypothetical protein